MGSNGSAQNILPAYIKNLHGTSMLAWKEKHLSGWLKEEQYLYKKINQREMKQATTLPHYMSLVDN